MSNEQINNNEMIENTECCGSGCCETETATATRPTVTAKPTFYVAEQESGISVEIDLPGVAKENTKVTSEGDQLTVAATRNDKTPEEWNLLNQSSSVTDYHLKLNLNPKLDLAKTKATFQNGTLILEIPKKEEALPKQIDIVN